MRQYDVKKIEWLSLLGQGTFSYVWKCKYKDEVIAIKRTCKCSNKISREYEILLEVNECEHCIALYDIFYSKNEQGQVFQHLITEYVEQSLYDVLSSSVILSPSVIKSLLHQLLTACQFLHSRNIVHRDIKPENILLRKLSESSDKEYLLKICDFGSSKKLDPQKINNPYVVSRFYRAPELCLAMTNYTTKIDIFSVGCIFIELYSKQAFFKSKKDEEQIWAIFKNWRVPSQKEWSDVISKHEHLVNVKLNSSNLYIKEFPLSSIQATEQSELVQLFACETQERKLLAFDLACKLLEFNPEKRIGAEEALQHPYFKSESTIETQ